VINEADTCRKYVLPKLYAAGWNDDQISEQKSFTDGRIVPVGPRGRRKPCKRADYLLRYARDFMLAVVEAKAAYRLPGDGLQQAKDYATTLGLKFAYSTNGHSIHFQTPPSYGSDFAPARKSKMSKPQIDS
jgi:type I restriction enzyme, R subunit